MGFSSSITVDYEGSPCIAYNGLRLGEVPPYTNVEL